MFKVVGCWHMKVNHAMFRCVRKIPKTTISFVMSVRPSKTTRPPLDGFSWNLIFEHFLKTVEKIEFYWSLTGITGTLHEEQCTFMMKTFSVLLRIKNMPDKSCSEHKNTHFMLNKVFFSKNVPFVRYVEKYCRLGQAKMKIWRMHIACWIPKATNPHSEYVILIAFPLQERLYESASMLQYKYFACLVMMHAYISRTYESCTISCDVMYHVICDKIFAAQTKEKTLRPFWRFVWFKS